MEADVNLIKIILGIIIGMILAVLYALRVLVIMERRIARMDINMLKIVNKIYRDEDEILEEEKKIERLLVGKPKKTANKPKKKPAKKKKK
ncbi:MAG TPA: hypothetical protein ENN46_02605 [Candidatus Woesearchaeota archaeon]|nr:hypothetical protein [Candidatus Woesearchaeota archaeon]